MQFEDIKQVFFCIFLKPKFLLNYKKYTFLIKSSIILFLIFLLSFIDFRFIRKKWECKLNMNQIKEMPLHFYGESFTLFILGIITVNRVFSSVSNQLSVKSTLKSVSWLILLLFISILLTSLIALKNREDPKLEANENK